MRDTEFKDHDLIVKLQHIDNEIIESKPNMNKYNTHKLIINDVTTLAANIQAIIINQVLFFTTFLICFNHFIILKMKLIK